MTDSSLDDFFAKKDKSKKSKTTKGKYTTSEQITKKFEKSQRKSSPNELTSGSNSIQIATISAHTREDDDDWNEIEMEKEKDYSGLRIQALSIADREKEEELAKELQPQENGDDNKLSEANIGPWKLCSSAGATSGAGLSDFDEPEQVETPEPALEVETAPAKSGAYLPPARRNNSSQAGIGSGGSGLRRHGKHVPEIDSELHFPSLSQAVETPKGNAASEKTFQSVKHGSRSKDDSFQQPIQLDLGNKYSALGTN